MLFCDLETFSECPISRGAYRYAEDPTTEVLLWGYAVGHDPAKVWDVASGAPIPSDLKQALAAVCAGRDSIVWHNGFNFDTNVLRLSRNPAVSVDIPRDRIVDTMHMAYQHGLPGALGDLSVIYGLSKDVAKDRDGKRLVQLFCKPHTYGRDDPAPVRYDAKNKPEEWKRFVNYCRLDVEAERALFKKLPRFNLTAKEHELQLLDDEINRRGMLMDTELATRAIAILNERAADSRRRTEEMTDGSVASATQTQALRAFLKDRFGLDLPNLQKAEIGRLLDSGSLPEPVNELLRIRLSSAKASVRKYQSIIDCVNSDHRLRGGLQFRGAARTGRWSGRLFQPQNLPRQTLSPEEVNERIAEAMDGSLPDFSSDPEGDLAQCIRGAIMVPPGKKMVVADYSNIEGRVLAWLADEKWKLDAFRKYDLLKAIDGTTIAVQDRPNSSSRMLRDKKGSPIHVGHDLYKLTYSRAFNCDVEKVTKPQRQMGKVLELAMGYGGGVGAFVTFARGYGVDLADMARSLQGSIPVSVLDDAERLYEWAYENKRLGGLSHEVWIACDSVKRLWRNANTGIVKLWKTAGDACVKAIAEKGTRVPLVPEKNVYAQMRGSWLLLRLPSGRFLCYPAARAEEDGAAFSYLGMNQYTRKWGRINTFGGKIVENLIQATACDVLSSALFRVNAAGYKPILTVHDEVLTEAPDSPDFNHLNMEGLMAQAPEWGAGLPLAADGFDSYRYHK